MATLLKQSTAVDLPIGPFVDSGDGFTPETGLTLTQPDIRLKKNGGNCAQKNAAQTLSHEENGWYEVSLDTTDTDTLGQLMLAVNESGALPVWREFLVVPAAVYDGLVSGTGNGVRADVQVIAANAITAAAIATDAIDADAIADNAIDAGAIASNAITAAKIATDAITAAKIATDAITAAKIAADAITAAKIADGAIDAATFAAGAIDAAAIANGAIDAATFAAGAIDAAAIAANAIGASELAADAVDEIVDAVWDELLSGHSTLGTAGRILRRVEEQLAHFGTAQAGGATSITLDAGASAVNDYYVPGLVLIRGGTGAGQFRRITAYNGTTKVATVATAWATNPDATSEFSILPWASVRVSELDTDVITAASIAANAIGAAEIADGAITAAKIATDAIDADALADGAITAATFAAGAIDATAIANGAIDAATFAAGAINAAAIATGAIDADALATDAVAEIADGVWDEQASGHFTLGTFGQGQGLVRASTAQAGAAGSLTLDAGANANDDFYNNTILFLTGGTGAGQARIISDYVGSTKVASVSPNWVVTPDGTTEFVIKAFGAIPGATAPTAGEVADAVWDEILSGHLGAGSTGEALNAAGAAGDPWVTSLPGAYGAGSAGNIVGNQIPQINNKLGAFAATGVNTVLGFFRALLRSDLAAPSDVGGTYDSATDSLEAQTDFQTTALNSIAGRIGAFLGTGTNTIYGWLRSLFRDDLAVPSDIGGAYDPATDSLEALRDNQQPAAAAALTAYDGPTHAELISEINDVQADVAGVLADTNDIQTRLPAALVSGRMSSDAVAVNGSTNAAANLARSARTIVLGTVGVGSTTTSIVTSSLDPAATVADQFKGRVVIFLRDTTTAALQSQATEISASSSGGVLTVVALTTAPVSGDLFVIV